ncbi:hypothetical protein ISS85_04795 [Candidatus Microgenomates bacterium]|nr:hypothetical protein [Candidatus Microgenomates bacterium]
MFERMFPRVISALKAVEEECADNSTEMDVVLKNGAGGIIRFSNSGRCLEFFGEQGGYWASVIDDTESFLHPVVTERIGVHEDRQVTFRERVVSKGERFENSPPEAKEVFEIYSKNSEELHKKIGVSL